MERRQVNLVGPTILIGIGVILLLNNLGHLDWTLWDALQLWPILPVAAGVGILAERRSLRGSIAAAAIVAALIAMGIWLGGTEGLGMQRGEIAKISYGRGDATSAMIQLQPTVNTISIGALTDPGELIRGSIGLRHHETLGRDVASGSRTKITLSSQGLPHGALGLGPTAPWQLDINSGVALNLGIDVAIGAAQIDLGDLTVDAMRLDFGIGRTEIIVPTSADAAIEVDGGIGTVRVSITRDVGARITVDAGLVGRTIPPSYKRSGDTYTSPNYRRADTRVDLSIGLGIGSVRVEHVLGD